MMPFVMKRRVILSGNYFMVLEFLDIGCVEETVMAMGDGLCLAHEEARQCELRAYLSGRGDCAALERGGAGAVDGVVP